MVKSNNGKEEQLTMVEAVVYRINDLCKQHDMSIYELAKLSGVTQSTINEIMQGRSLRPRIDTLAKIASGFGLKIAEFLDSPVFDNIKDINIDENKERIAEKKRRRKLQNQKTE